MTGPVYTGLMTVTNNAARSRYELQLGADVAIAVYREQPGVVVITHTEVPPALRHKGIGAQLVAGVLDDITARGLKVVPRCPFVARVIAGRPEYRALVADGPAGARPGDEGGRIG